MCDSHDLVEFLQFNSICNKKSVENKEWVCRTCHSHLIKNRVLPCAVANDMVFRETPDFFHLTELECSLLAAIIAFQKLMQAPTGRQIKIDGNIVNVPAAVTNMVSMLPQLQSETSTIKINLKRKFQYKSAATSSNVRPYKVVEAAKWLMNNNSLYKHEGIAFDNNWLNEDNDNDISNQQSETVDENHCNDIDSQKIRQ